MAMATERTSSSGSNSEERVSVVPTAAIAEDAAMNGTGRGPHEPDDSPELTPLEPAKDTGMERAGDESADEPASISPPPPLKTPEKEGDSTAAAGGNATESDEEIPLRRLTRNRASLLHLEESDAESDKGGGRQRPRRQRAQYQQSSSKVGKGKADGKKKKSGPTRGGKGGADESDDDDTPGEYVPVQVGDCVLLDSGDPENHYIALVSSVQRSQNFANGDGTFTAQWYYKPDDIRQEVRNLIVGGVLEGEVFLSPHKDKNSIDAVIGLCNVVSPDEYDEVQSEIKRGFREKTKPYYICRYKYYPGRPIKKALEVVKNDAIRSGLGPMKPKIGDDYQVPVPAWDEATALKKQASLEEQKAGDDSLATLPWKLPESASEKKSASSRRYTQLWSPLVLEHQSLALDQFQQMLGPLKYAVGNVLKTFRRDSSGKATTTTATPGHVRCIVLSSVPSDHIQVVLSTGHVKAVLPSELCSPLGDDVALNHFYRMRFNLCAAIKECADVIVTAQASEREAYRKEVVEFSQLALQARQELAAAAAIEVAGMDLTEDEEDDHQQEKREHDEQDDGSSGSLRKRRK